MITLFKTEEEKKTTVSTFKDPFKSDKVTEIRMVIRNDYWSNYQTEFKATVSFKNGDTSGDHIIKGKDFPDLVQKVEAFIKNL